MSNYKVIAYIDSQKTPFSVDLECYGLKYNPEEHCWVRSFIKSKKFLNDFKKFCKKNHIKYKIVDSDYERNSTYRKDFFDNHKYFGNYYFCAYCGEIHKKEDITVDHIIPVNAAKNNKFLRKVLKFFGIDNINDVKNLTPACKYCNSQKGAKVSGWLLKGFMGKYERLWIIRIFCEFIFLLLTSFTIFYYLGTQTLWILN